MKKTLFTIAFEGRSGSSYLEGLIDSHPKAQCLGEIFCDNGEYILSGLSIPAFLDERVHNVNVLASGFKLALIHVRQTPHILPVLAEKNYKAIISNRQNKVNQYISRRLAEINSVWRSDFGVYTHHSFVAQPASMLKYLERMENEEHEVLAFTDELERIVVPYERITQRDTMEEMLSFLDLPHAELASVYARQRQETSQRAGIENYDEVVEFFSTTRWKDHFEDTTK